jgi:hypothetical protein
MFLPTNPDLHHGLLGVSIGISANSNGVVGFVDTRQSDGSANLAITAAPGSAGTAAVLETIVGNTGHILIGTATDNASGALLQVNGPGIQINGAAQGTCNAAHRGMIQYTAAASGIKDTVAVCAKDASDVYAWRTIY